ncbi:MAG: S-layer homology domain-containing protein [Oscillospiraceae bacterium]
MKKRIISLLLVALMLVSIAPFGAMAAGNTVITEQPSDVSVNVGETATFSIAATNPNSTDLKYLWFDADEINTNNISLKDLRDTIDKIEKAKLGEEQVLTLTDVQQSMSIRCAVYYEIEKTILGYTVTVPTDLVFSKTVKLTVTGGETPSPDPSTSPDPSATTTPSTSPSVKPEDCTHANPEHHAATENNTCDPHIEYWYCPDCKTYFTDAECTNEIRKSKLDDGMTKDKNKHTALKKVPSKAATCTEEGNIEHWYCSGCDNYYTDANATVKTSHAKVTTKKADHDYYWVADEVANVHYEKCRVCGKTSGTSNHSGGTASCKAQAKCEKCGASYGEFDATNHVNFEYKNAVKPTETTKGYTGDKYCADCGVFIEEGTEYSAQCTGGCKDLKLVKGTPKTCTADGTIDYYECPKCHNIYRDEKGTILLTEADLVDKCTGHDLHPGPDFFGNINMNNLKQFALSIGISLPQIVQMIRDGTFDLDHIIGTIKIKDIDHCHDDTDHWLGCQRCGKTLEDLRDELSSAGIEINEKWYELSRKTPHSGGKATCQTKAVCDECGDAYGELGEHRYDSVVTAPTCTKGGYTTHTCSACKDSYKDSETSKTGHIIEYGVCKLCKGRFSNPFYDVNGSDWYYSAVMWAYYNSPLITTGTDETHFSPAEQCTRAQVVTFLWRAAGRPEPTGSGKLFSDVPNTNQFAPYYKAIQWAVEQGITKGTGNGSTFSPNDPVTRAQFVTFLWRYAGEPSPKNLSSNFNDIDANQFYYKAVLWAAENGITEGYGSPSLFAPGATCKRSEVVTFLFRAFSKGGVN